MDAQGQIDINLVPEHPIIAIWNNKQYGCRIAKKVHSRMLEYSGKADATRDVYAMNYSWVLRMHVWSTQIEF